MNRYRCHTFGTIERQTEIRDKKWGSEEIVINEDHCVKIMRLKPGQQVSLHWHLNKEETFILFSGALVIETIDSLGTMSTTTLTTPLESFTLMQNVPHTFYCPEGQDEETVFVEASTRDHKNDSYRVYPSGTRGEYSINRRPAD